MKKRITILAMLLVLAGIFCSCGSSSGTGGAGTANVGPFSGVGGWKAEEGAILILEEGGSGITLSEVKYEGENIPDYLPWAYKSDVKWEEDAETVKIKVAEAEYPYVKKKEGDNETLEVNGITFARLSEDKLKEYKEKAETATALPTSQTDTSATGSTEENKKTEFTDTILLDNEYVTVELTQFFEKKVNWAGREPQIEKYITLKVHNNSDKEYLFNLQDAYIKDESVIASMQDGNSGPAPGKTKTYTYDIYYNTSPDPTALDSLEDLYTLDAKIQISISDGDKDEAVAVAKAFYEDGFKVIATSGTAKLIEAAGIPVERVNKIYEGQPNIEDWIINGKIQLIVNTPAGKTAAHDDSYLRKGAIKHRVTYITTMVAAKAAAEGISQMNKHGNSEVLSLQEWHALIK